jgi:hypothetical protein
MEMTPARALKFRQASFVYLHFSILYEAGAYVMYRQELLPANAALGPPPWVWVFVLGPLVAGSFFIALLKRPSAWLAGILWFIGAGRIPTLIHGAFITTDTGALAPSLYLTALIVSVINMWMLARAAWDL